MIRKFGQEIYSILLLNRKRLQGMGTGQANVKAYNRRLCNLIAAGKAQPSFLVTHELPLGAVPEAYRRLDARENGWVKVLLKPAA